MLPEARKKSPADVASEGAHPEEEKLTARGRNSPTEAKGARSLRSCPNGVLNFTRSVFKRKASPSY